MTVTNAETWLYKINPSLKLFVLMVLCIVALFIDDLNYMINVTMGVLLIFLCFTGHSIKRIILLSIPFGFIFISTSLAMIFLVKGRHFGLNGALYQLQKKVS